MCQKGGNEQIYKESDNRKEFAESLAKQHPDVVYVTKKFGRWHHQVNYKLFKKNRYATILFKRLVNEFNEHGKENKFTPVFLFMPQKDDLLLIRKKGRYYKRFIKDISKEICVIDLTDDLINRKDLDDIYSDDNQYGGHYSKIGNKLIAKIIHDKLKQKKLI